MKKLALFASHNGSVLETLLDAIEKKELKLEISLIISNNSNANVLEKAQKYNIPYQVLNSKTDKDPDKTLYTLLKEKKIDLILLAGYMKKISPLLTQNFFILNSHPALLPKYGGKGMYGENVHKAVIENNESQSGVTLHRIDEEYDKGAIILQKKLTLSSEENVQSLQKKIKELEKSATIEALKICLK